MSQGQLRFKIFYSATFFTGVEGDDRPIKGDCYLNGPSREVIEQMAFVAMAEYFMKEELVLKSLSIDEIEDAVQIPDEAKGETRHIDFDKKSGEDGGGLDLDV